jgi:hypothetical protein
MTTRDIPSLVTLTEEVIARACGEAELLEYSALDRGHLARLRRNFDALIAAVTRFAARDAAFGGGLLSERKLDILESLVMATDVAADALEAIRARNPREADVCARDLDVLGREAKASLLDAMRALPFSDAVVRDFRVLDDARAALAEQQSFGRTLAKIVQRKS